MSIIWIILLREIHLKKLRSGYVIHSKKTIIILWIFVDIIVLILLFGLVFFAKQKVIFDYIKFLITFIVFILINKTFLFLYKSKPRTDKVDTKFNL